MGEDTVTWGDALDHHRSAGFVGRREQFEQLERLVQEGSGVRVLLITGVGGIGKTTLLQAFRRWAIDRGIPVSLVDARDLPSEAGQLRGALDERLPDPREGGLLMLDTFEHIAAQERWLREHYLPQLPAGARVVVAGRWTPATAWSVDPGWAALTHVERLADFTLQETAECLSRHGLDSGWAERIQAFTRGHPLAVALAAQVLRRDPDRRLEMEETPEIVRALVSHQIDDAPGETEQHALYSAGLARNLTEDLLEGMLRLEDARQTFVWLRQQSFMREGPRGLQPHELVGEALRVELKWRDPQLHRDLIRRAMAHLLARLRQDTSEHAFMDLLYPLREFPPMRVLATLEQDTGLYSDLAGGADLPELSELVEHYEGATSRAWFEFWAARQPEGIVVVRDAHQRVAGFNFCLDVTAPDEAAREDPAVRLFTDYLAHQAPLRRGERAHLFRFYIDRESHQAMAPAMTQLRSIQGFHPFRQPDLAFQGTVRMEGEQVRTRAHYSGIPPLPGCEFRLEGLDYFIAGHDWRVEPAVDWLRNVTERFLASSTDTGSDQRAGTVLSEAEFREAVESALKARAAGEDMAEHRLTESCLVRQRKGAHEDPGTVLAAILDEAILSLARAPETETAGQVLDRTYRNPAPKQRAAAAAVGLSYGTYRRRLREAIAALVDRLWRAELEAARHGTHG
jgi:hypothetical protein